MKTKEEIYNFIVENIYNSIDENWEKATIKINVANHFSRLGEV